MLSLTLVVVSLPNLLSGPGNGYRPPSDYPRDNYGGTPGRDSYGGMRDYDNLHDERVNGFLR